MSMNLVRVTITGADDSIEPEALLPLAKRYPFLEIALLFSAKRGGTVRFPSQDWLGRLGAIAANVAPLNLSAHLCGDLVRNVCIGSWGPADAQVRFQHLFRRVQLNFHAEPHDIGGLFIDGFRGRPQQVIFQYDGVNNRIFHLARSHGVDAVPLFDLSHGAGVLPGSWPAPIEPYCGYAGGLGPDNLAEQLPRIAKAAGDVPFWIDCETRVRSDKDRQFDLAKAERFLEIAAPHVKDGAA